MCPLHHLIFLFFLSGTRELAVQLVGTAAVSDPAAVCQPAMVLLEATFPPHQQQPPSSSVSSDRTVNDLPPRHIKQEELTPLAAPQHSWSGGDGLKSSGLEAGRTQDDGGPIEAVHATKEELSWEMANIGKYTYAQPSL